MGVSAVLLAGGQGERFGASLPKALMSLNGKPVLQHSIDVIEPHVDEVIVVAAKPYRHYRHALPGPTRGDSALNGVLATQHDKVLIHDGARPFVTERIVQEVITALAHSDSVDTAVPILDGYLEHGLPRPKTGRWLGQTPEAFDKQILLEAFRHATHPYDDEVSMVWDTLGITPWVVEGIHLNTKITYPKDLENAEGIMRSWREPIATTPNLTGPVLILGGSGGIGKALTWAIPRTVTPTRSELDLTKPFDIDLSQYQAIVHAAGEYANEDQIMAVNFDSVTCLVDLAAAQQWRGNIVAFSSTAGAYGRPGIALYSASKAALNTWIEATHVELAEHGIYLNAIAPAKVDTRLQHTINPDADRAQMLTPRFVASRTLPYLDTTAHGHIVYLRVGFS